VGDHELGEGAQPGQAVHLAAVVPGDVAVAAQRVGVLAEVGHAAVAVPAVAADGADHADDAVAHPDGLDRGADLFDDARTLMAEDERQGRWERALEHGDVRVAHAAGADAHDHVVRTERGELDVLELEVVAVLDAQSSSHGR
jgi:hypothetical protein